MSRDVGWHSRGAIVRCTTPSAASVIEGSRGAVGNAHNCGFDSYPVTVVGHLSHVRRPSGVA
jgi:hypothetical protein